MDPAWQRPTPTAEQRRRDVFTGVFVAAGALLALTLLASTGSAVLGPPPSWPERVAWSLAITVPLCWRRRWPEVTAVVVAAAYIGAQVRHNPENLVASIALFIAIFTLGAWGRHRRRAVLLRVAIIAAMFLWLGASMVMAIADLESDPFPDARGPLPAVFAALLSSVLLNVVFFLAAYLLGDTAWVSARRQHEIERQAEALRRSQAELAERAVVEERVRIARELHDVVAHHVAVMGVQAAASRRVMDRDPVKAKAALTAVEQTARTAVDELRRLLGVLRAAGDAEAPAGLGLDQVDELLQGARDAGLDVRYRVFGDAAELPDSVSVAVYRILQEALTNTIKHARASTVDVRVRHLRRELELDVTDDGRPVPGASTQGAGLGLVGMRERVAAHDGVLEVGPLPGGGFRVRARLPVQAPVPAGDVS